MFKEAYSNTAKHIHWCERPEASRELPKAHSAALHESGSEPAGEESASPAPRPAARTHGPAGAGIDELRLCLDTSRCPGAAEAAPSADLPERPPARSLEPSEVAEISRASKLFSLLL